MSYKAVEWAFKEGPDNAHDLLVLVALAEFADPRGHCFPSVTTLAAKCRMSERGTRYCIRRLTEAGYLRVEIGSWKEGSSRYQLVKRMREGGAQPAPPPGAPHAPPAPDAPLHTVPQVGHTMPQGGAPGAPKPVIEPANEPSEAKASGAEGAGGEVVDFIKEVFDLGVGMLLRSGMKEREARIFVGKLRREAGDPEVFQALREAQRAGPTDLVSWLVARLQPPPTINTAALLATALADLRAKGTIQ